MCFSQRGHRNAVPIAAHPGGPSLSLGGCARSISPFMKTPIDLKSAWLGLAVGILITLGIVAASSSGGVGRYQIAGAGSHALIIDTATGQVWDHFLPFDRELGDPGFFPPKVGAKK